MGRLLLWDIDGTLLTASKVSRDSLFAAAEEVLNRPVGDVHMQTAGKTDPMIVTDLLEQMQVPEDEMVRSVRLVLRKFGPQLAARRQQISAAGQVFPGVRQILAELDATRAITTVLTGNIAVNAICKLDAFRLTRHFDLEVGAFGSDDAVRTQLVDVALKRSGDKRKKYFDNEEIWIIGDTPSDFEVARMNQTHCLLVATGRHSFDELNALGADVVVHDLTDTEALVSLLAE